MQDVFLPPPSLPLPSPLLSLPSPPSPLLSPLYLLHPPSYYPPGVYFLLIPFLAWRPSLFRRQKIRASIIDSFYPVNSELPEALCSGLLVAMTKIYFLLKPLGKPVGTNPRGHHANRQAHSLGYLLLEAARLHFDMRREPDTVYCLYSKRPGKVVDLDHVSCEVPRLPMYDKPEQGKPKLRLHVVLAPGIIALQKFIIKEKKFRVRVIAPILAAAEWVNDDQLNRALKLSENIW